MHLTFLLATTPPPALPLSSSNSCLPIPLQIADMVAQRAELGKNFGVVLIPEGLVEFMHDVSTLISGGLLPLFTCSLMQAASAACREAAWCSAAAARPTAPALAPAALRCARPGRPPLLIPCACLSLQS